MVWPPSRSLDMPALNPNFPVDDVLTEQLMKDASSKFYDSFMRTLLGCMKKGSMIEIISCEIQRCLTIWLKS